MEAQMSDLIIHDVPESLRQQLDDVARASGRSPSEEAIDMLAEALAKRPAKTETAKPNNAWDAFRAAIGEENLMTEEESEEFNKVLEESRWAPMRPVPDFE
jgi:hypothetical protein